MCTPQLSNIALMSKIEMFVNVSSNTCVYVQVIAFTSIQGHVTSIQASCTQYFVGGMPTFQTEMLLFAITLN